MYVSDRVHHSVVKAAHLVGIPSDAIRTVGTDAAGRCDTTALAQNVEADIANGRKPFLIAGVAGSTDTGSIDPLERLADIAASAGAWFHVDAAYGGFFALTKRGRARLSGIDRADSVTVDAHKGLFLPYSVGALLVRDPSDLVDTHEGWGSYLVGFRLWRACPITSSAVRNSRHRIVRCSSGFRCRSTGQSRSLLSLTGCWTSPNSPIGASPRCQASWSGPRL